MKKILIILDNSVLSTSFSSWLYSRHKEETADIIFAFNEREAIEAFKTNKVDVLIMELTEKILEILLFGIKNSPKTELIMMINSNNLKSGTLFDFHIVKKPSTLTHQKYLLKCLVKSIFKGDYLSKTIGKISIKAFLFLLIFVKKHGIININDDLSSYVYFNQSRLWGAKYKEFEGEEAVFNILEKNITTVSFANNSSENNLQRQIFTPFRYLLIKYHQATNLEKKSVEKEIKVKKPETQEITIKNKKEVMSYLQELYNTEGYLASTVSDVLGNILIDNYPADSYQDFTTFDFISFMSNIVKNIALNQCNFIRIDYEKASICSFSCSNRKVIINVLLKPNANIGMVKLILNKFSIST